MDVECSTKDLHSGCFGGTMYANRNFDLFYLFFSLSSVSSHEAMTDLIAIMNSLVNSQGKILIDGVYDEVAELLPEEEKLYEAITFDTVR